MEEHEATFEIESESDAYAVERVMDQLYDSLREESRTVRDGTTDSRRMLEQFRSVRDAVRSPKPGRFTVVYEPEQEGFDE